MLNELDSSAQGLSAAEALQRLRHYCANEIAERHRNPVLAAITVAALTSRAEDNDPIDMAVLAAGEPPRVRLEGFTPFDPVSKCTDAVVRDCDGHGNGAPQIITALCDHDSAAAQISEVVDRFAGPSCNPEWGTPNICAG